jgi:hypothetical protein
VGAQAPLIVWPGSWERHDLFATFATLAVALASLGEASADAPRASDDLPLQLSWSAPAGCPSAASVREEIHRRIGSAGGLQASVPILAAVDIRADAPGSFHLFLRTSIGQVVGERELSGQDCGQIASAAALVLALLISPRAGLAPEPPSDQSASTPGTPAVPDVPSSGRAQTRWLTVAISGVLAARVLPSLAEGLDLRLAMRGVRWAALFRAGGFFAQEVAAPILPGAKASFYRLEWALAACAHTSPDRRVGAGLCLGGTLVRLSGESAGVSNPGAVSAFWPEVLAEVLAELRLAAWARLHLSLEGHALGRPPDFAIVGLGSVYRPAGASVRGALGFEVLF